MERRKWSATKVASWVFTILTLSAMAGMAVLFTIQSLPVWKHSGSGFVTGTEWFYRDGKFGAAPMIYGTLVVGGIALLLAAPIGVGAAIFISEFLPRRFRLLVKSAIELLAGIPSVVYGLLGILLLRNWIYEALEAYDPLTGDTLLTAGILLAVMILPTVVTLTDDALRGVPSVQRLASRGLGLNAGECVIFTILPQAAPGIVAAVLLAAGRALGETIAVILIVGRQDNQWPESLLSLQPLIEAGQTLTSKLGGSETNIAYGEPLHWGAIVGLGLILLVISVLITLLGVWLRRLSSRHAA